MIAWWLVAKRLWPILVLFAVGVFLGLYGHTRYAAGEAAGKAQVQAAWDAQVKAQEVAQAKLQAEADKVLEGYQDELEKLRDRPVPSPRVIRVCKSADTGGLRVAGAAERPSGAETGGVLLGLSELDTGPLRRAAAEADEINAAYRFLTNRDNAMSATK